MLRAKWKLNPVHMNQTCAARWVQSVCLICRVLGGFTIMQTRVQTVLIFHRVQGSQLDSEVGLVCEKVEYLTEHSSSTAHRHVTNRHSLITNRVWDWHAEEGEKLTQKSSPIRHPFQYSADPMG